MDTRLAGKKGGLETAKKGRRHFRILQRLSVEARKKNLLDRFTDEELNNPITAQSVIEKLKQIK